MSAPATTKYAQTTIIAVVVANMIGTGVFTSLGFQLVDLRSGFVLLALWVIGGIVALCGAMSYAELGATMPRSGGEYNFLTRIYHPAAGFASGWVSATIGFAAPSALAAMTFAAYATSAWPAEFDTRDEQWIAVALVIVLTLIPASSRRQSGGLQAAFTALKVAAIVAFCIAALIAAPELQPVSVRPQSGDAALLTSGTFAVSLIYVSYAYTGWNAATYLSSELGDPQRDLPRILFIGTAVVTVLYTALNYVFLKVAPMSAMVGQVEIGYVAARFAFGEAEARFAGVTLAVLLISTVSAMTVAGPRVLQVIGEDFPALGILARTNKDQLPYVAISVQSLLTILFIVTSTFESVLVFAGFTLALNSFVTVLGVFVLRWRRPELERPFETFAYPFTPLVYLAVTGWTLAFVLNSKPVEGLAGLGVVVTGLIVYFIVSRRQ
ncbi:MAG: amino acid permease [Woeseiaceae bacterium]|nr:amino acid permease [Woeseiaceae bacterium]